MNEDFFRTLLHIETEILLSEVARLTTALSPTAKSFDSPLTVFIAAIPDNDFEATTALGPFDSDNLSHCLLNTVHPFFRELTAVAWHTWTL